MSKIVSFVLQLHCEHSTSSKIFLIKSVCFQLMLSGVATLLHGEGLSLFDVGGLSEHSLHAPAHLHPHSVSQQPPGREVAVIISQWHLSIELICGEVCLCGLQHAAV